jgi:hypothetical protein
MKIQIKESDSKECLEILKEINGKFELSKPQIIRGNVVNVQIGNKNLSIRL